MAQRQRNRPKQAAASSIPTGGAAQREEFGSDESAVASDIAVLSDSLVRESIPISRERRIELVAYRLAEQRGFEPGHELQDWLQAEKEIDTELGNASASHSNASRP